MRGFFEKDGKHRGVQIFKSTVVSGPYSPISSGPVTPEDWDCLDGTLFIEENSPWLVFSHEWTQIHDGAICAIPRRVLVGRRGIVYIRILCSFRLHALAGRLKVLLH